MLEHVIEGYLMQIDLCGYDIKQNIDSLKFYNASYGSIYPTLKRMEEEGLITASEIIEGGKFKKVYSINATGKERFIEWLQIPPDIRKSENEHLIKMSFYQHLPQVNVRELMSEFIDGVELHIDSLELMKAVLEKDINYYQNATLDYTIQHYRFIKNWYRKFLNERDC